MDGSDTFLFLFHTSVCRCKTIWMTVFTFTLVVVITYKTLLSFLAPFALLFCIDWLNYRLYEIVYRYRLKIFIHILSLISLSLSLRRAPLPLSVRGGRRALVDDLSQENSDSEEPPASPTPSSGLPGTPVPSDSALGPPPSYSLTDASEQRREWWEDKWTIEGIDDQTNL